MQFLILTRRRTEQFSEADFAPRVDDEAQQARALYAEGFIRQIWHRGDLPGACMLVEGEAEPQVRATLNTLPFVKAGMLEVLAVIPLRPYAGFGPRRS